MMKAPYGRVSVERQRGLLAPPSLSRGLILRGHCTRFVLVRNMFFSVLEVLAGFGQHGTGRSRPLPVINCPRHLNRGVASLCFPFPPARSVTAPSARSSAN